MKKKIHTWEVKIKVKRKINEFTISKMPKSSKKKKSLPSKLSTFYILYSLQRSWKTDQIYSIVKHII